MRRNYFNLSNFLDVTLYVLSILYILDFKIKSNQPNCENNPLVSRFLKSRDTQFLYFLILVLADADWLLYLDSLLVKPSQLLPTASDFWYFHFYSLSI